MKKIIAILLALAVVSMAFAQTVEISNTLSSEPVFTIKTGSNPQWGFDYGLVRDRIEGKASTEDGRASVFARIDATVEPYANKDVATGLAPAAYLSGLSTNSTSNIALNNRWMLGGGVNANAFIKPLEFLGVGVGTLLGDAGVCGTASFGPSINWEGDFAPASKGDAQRLFGFIGGNKGAYVAFLGDGIGVNGLTVSAGISMGSWIKKDLFPFAIGVKYENDLFAAGASWEAAFGAAYENEAANNKFNKGITTAGVTGTTAELVLDKAYNVNSFYVGGTFKGLQSLPVGITIDAAAAFVMNKSRRSTTDALITVDALFDFNNGITTKPAVTVGFNSGYAQNYKVLPFYIGNTLTYKPSDETKFELLTGYDQNGCVVATKEVNATTARLENSVTLKPSFEFTMGASTFSFAVKSVVDGHVEYADKTDFDWAATTIHSDSAKVSFPISWKYAF